MTPNRSTSSSVDRAGRAGRTVRSVVVVVAAVAVTACINPFAGGNGADRGDASSGSTVRIVENALSASTIVPDFRGAISTVTAELTPVEPVSNPDVTQSDSFSDPLFLEITDVAEGIYTLRVDAFDADSLKIGSSGEVPLWVDDDGVTAIVLLAPLRSGDGGLSLSITFPPGTIDAEFVALDPDPDTPGDEIVPVAGVDYGIDYGAGTFVYTTALPSGFYFLNVQFYQAGVALAPIIQAVNIYDNLVSAREIEIGAEALVQPPPAPSDLSVGYPFDGAIDLYWNDNSDTEAEFVVFREGVEHGLVAADTTFWNDPTPPPVGDVVTYEVKARNVFGDSTDGAATTEAQTYNFPTDVSPVSGASFSRPDSVTVEWGAADGLVSFDLYLSTDFAEVDLAEASARVLDGAGASVETYLFDAPMVGQYYWRVIARNSLGEEYLSPVWDFEVLPRTWYVAHAANGGDDGSPDGNDPATPFETLQFALDSAFPDEEIRLAGDAGETYGGNTVVVDKDVSIRGGWDAASFTTQDPVATPSILRSSTSDTTMVAAEGTISIDGVSIGTGEVVGPGNSYGIIVTGASTSVVIADSTFVGGFNGPAVSTQLIRLEGNGSVDVSGGSVLLLNAAAGTGHAVGIAIDGESSGSVWFDSSSFDPSIVPPDSAVAFQIEPGSGAASLIIANSTAPVIDIGNAQTLLSAVISEQAAATLSISNNSFLLGSLGSPGELIAVDVPTAQSVFVNSNTIVQGDATTGTGNLNAAVIVGSVGSATLDFGTITVGDANGDVFGIRADTGATSPSMFGNDITVGQSTAAAGGLSVAIDVLSGTNAYIDTNTINGPAAPNGDAFGIRLAAEDGELINNTIASGGGAAFTGYAVSAAGAYLEANEMFGVDSGNPGNLYGIRAEPGSDNIVLFDNEIVLADADNPQTGISIETGPQGGAIVERNRVSVADTSTSNTGIYVGTTRSWIVNNVVAKASGSVGINFTAMAFETTAGGDEAKQFYVYNNTIVAEQVTVAATWYGIALFSNAAPEFRNNIVAGTTSNTQDGTGIEGAGVVPYANQGNAFSFVNPVVNNTGADVAPVDPGYGSVQLNGANYEFPYPDAGTLDPAGWYETTPGAPFEIRQNGEDLTVEPAGFAGSLPGIGEPYRDVFDDQNGLPRTPGTNGFSIGAFEVD